MGVRLTVSHTLTDLSHYCAITFKHMVEIQALNEKYTLSHSLEHSTYAVRWLMEWLTNRISIARIRIPVLSIRKVLLHCVYFGGLTNRLPICLRLRSFKVRVQLYPRSECTCTAYVDVPDPSQCHQMQSHSINFIAKWIDKISFNCLIWL